MTTSGAIEGGRGGNSGHSNKKDTAFTESGSGGNGIVFLEGSSGNTLLNSGTVLGGRAGNADPDTWNLAGIGGDGVWGKNVSISITNTGLIQGGGGGDGGARGPDDAYTYLKGGYGGDGVYIENAQPDSSITNKGRIIGGEGGTGTAGDKANPVLRGGGPGGWGIYAENLTIINDAGAEITGGKGGTSLDLSKGAHGNGGEGIYGFNLRVLTSGTISGGFDGSGTVQANAIIFTTGNNYLELGPGFIMNGNVVVESGSSTLALGGSGNATFDVSKIGILGTSVQYQGFSTFLKTGNSVWTLTGSPAQGTPWTIEQGVLQISANSNLGVDTNPLTFDSTGASGTAPPTLRFGATGITLSRNVVLATDGTFDTFGNTATITGDIAGTGGLVKTSAGSLILSGNNTYSGDTLVKAGALVAGKANVFISSSAHTIESGAALDLAGFNQTIDEVKNAGIIITNGTAPDPDTTLTVTNSYVGAGGTLELSTFLGTDGSPSDRLVIDGGTASGNSFLRIKNADGLGALTTGDGILVVEATNGGITASNAFALSGRAVAGPYEYSLYRSGFVANPTNENSWYLRSHLLGAPEIPHYREETSNYTALPPMTLLYGQNLIGTLHERVGEEEDIRSRSDLHEKTPDTGAWGRVFGIYGKQNGDKRGIYGDGPKYDYDFVGLQVGHDLYRSERPDGSRNHLGVYFAYGYADGTVTHFDGARGSNKFDAYTLGGYWTHFGESGWYTDTVLQGSYYDATSSSLAHEIPRLNVYGTGLAVSVEGGKPFRFDKGWFIEPQAQLIYQNIDINDAKDIGARITFNDVDSLAGRIGARLGRTWMRDTGRQMTMWVRPNIWHEFRGKTVTKFSSADGPVPFQSNLNGSWGEINVGVSGQLDRKTTLFANASYNERFDGKGHGYNGKIGIRVNW
ncbi:MAG: autotransporter outer membrane beta-barrel domain-containing protein [Proteobacteria bacterium]|nr:autotransporter outer membrane beta-barrel domain-containing protein [Pseudomonadota bacterium]